MKIKPWETPLSEYLGLASVISGAVSLEKDGPANLMAIKDRAATWPIVATASRPDLVLRVGPHTQVAAFDSESGELLGGYTATYPFVLREHRGRGIAPEMHFLIDQMGQRQAASCYTPSGFGARIATHRLHVERALEAGKEIPSDVMQDYRYSPTAGLALRTPYTAEAHQAWCAKRAAHERALRHSLMTDGYFEVFRGPDEDRDRSFDDYDPAWKGYLIAIALHRDFGCGFRAHVQGKTCLVQAEFEDVVIDAIGIRPAEAAIADLVRRKLLDRPGDTLVDPFFGKFHAGPISTALFSDETEMLAWLRPADADSPGRSMPSFTERSLCDARESLPGRRALRAGIFHEDPCPALS